jgi:hypothetical protein
MICIIDNMYAEQVTHRPPVRSVMGTTGAQEPRKEHRLLAQSRWRPATSMLPPLTPLLLLLFLSLLILSFPPPSTSPLLGNAQPLSRAFRHGGGWLRSGSGGRGSGRWAAAGGGGAGRGHGAWQGAMQGAMGDTGGRRWAVGARALLTPQASPFAQRTRSRSAHP